MAETSDLHAAELGDWLLEARTILDELEPRTLTILVERVFGFSDVPTLQELGERFGVTRERVRQIEEKATKAVLGAVASTRSLSTMVDRIPRLLGALFTAAEFSDFADVEIASSSVPVELQLVFFLAGPYQMFGGTFVRSGFEEWRFHYVDPPGYRMAQHFLRSAEFVAGAELLQTQVLEATLTPKSNPDHWQAGPNMLRSVFPITSDIYLVIPVGARPAFPTRSRPYTVSVRQTQDWLRRNGFVKLPGRGKGDHERYERGDGTQIGLDGTAREVSRLIERTVAKALGVSQREFRTAVSEGRSLPNRAGH